MDNNPERRNSDSSEEEEIYVLAQEPPDEPEDVWYDAYEIQPDDSKEEIHHHREEQPYTSEVVLNVKTSQKETKSELVMLPETENSTKETNKVLETNIDTLQQKHIKPHESTSQHKKWKLQSTRDNDEISITFHALIPSDIDFQTDTDKVTLYMWDGLYSKNILTEVDMKFVCYRQEAKHAVEVIGTALLKRKGHFTYGTLSYLYFIERKGIDQTTHKPRESMWEHVLKDSNYSKRTLHCTYLKNIQGNFHQYDGYIYQPHVKEGFLQTITGLFQGNSKTEDAEIVARTFARDIANSLLGDVPTSDTILEATNMSNCLRHCTERIYMIRDDMVRKTLWEVYTGVLRTLIGINEDLIIQRKISICILMLNLRYLVGFNANDPANELLCKSFLMKIDTAKRATVEWDYLQQSISSGDREILKEGLIRLADDISHFSSKGKNPSWMFLLPIIHFLEGTCKPFQETSMAADHRATQPKWWGISSQMEKVKDNFKKPYGIAWNIPLRRVIDVLMYLFEVDFYLPRSMMASLRLEELKDAIDSHLFPPEIGCASVVYFMNTTREYHDEQTQIEKCTESLLVQCQKLCAEGTDRRSLLLGLRISSDMLSTSLHQKRLNTVMNSTNIFLSFLARFDILFADTSRPEELLKQIISLSDINKATIAWINEYDRKVKPKMQTKLEIWDQFLSPLCITSTPHVNEWISEMRKSLSDKIHIGLQQHQLGQYERRLVEAYCSGIDTYSPRLQDLLSSFILMALTEHAEIEQTKAYQKLWHTMSKKFVEEWEKRAQENAGFRLETILSWSALPKFMKVLYLRGEVHEIGESCTEKVSWVKALVDHFVRVLLQGNVQVRELALIQKQSDIFLSLSQIFGYNDEQVKAALTLRTAELDGFYKKRSTLESLKLFCGSMEEVQVNTKDMDDLTKRNVEDSTLNDLVIVAAVTKETDVINVDVQLNATSLSEEVIDMIHQLELLKESVCFMTQLKQVSDELPKGLTLSLDDLCHKIFKPTLKRLQDRADQVLSGEMSCKDMEMFVGETCGDNFNTMWFELTTVCVSVKPNVLRERLDQFKQCREIILVTDVASALFQIQKGYSLSGDFSVVQYLRNYDVKNLNLNSDKSEILNASREFCCFTKAQVSCLKAFAKCEVLVAWLRKVITGGMKELKVFIDLGMTYAGDDAEKISRVQSLHAAVNGFSTLIFEMGQSWNCHEILRACETVWEELIKTPKLPDKLEYACRHLHWFKEIKQAHGAVEVKSFVQAEIINESGLYKIGTHVWEVLDEHDSALSIAELSDIRQVLKLIVVMDKKQDGQNEYAYDKLQDLQSRLMLVAGEADTSRRTVERFNLVLDGVVRLCNIYIKLVKSGCMLFQDFAIELHCDTNPDRPVVAILEFENEASHLKCRKTEEEQLEDVMHKIATAMETCYISWLEHVDRHRKLFPELNYFTTEQLVILQREFAKIGENLEPSKMIYPILHNIKQDCVPGEVRDAYAVTSDETETIFADTTEQKKQELPKNDEEEESEQEKFISELISLGYEKLVPFALKRFPDLDITDAIMWCMVNSENVEELENSQYMDSAASENDVYPKQTKDSVQHLVSKALDSKSQFDRCETMLEKLDEIWKQFLESITRNIKDFISLKHLGLLLRHLSKTDKPLLKRSLPKGFSETSPNLIVCENEDIWNQTLSLYLSDKSQPLPCADEVLTCSEDTTLEQVDIFLRRAFFYSNGKIHSIVNADRMSFSICECVEQRLLKYQRTVESANYRLVFICGAKSENRSVIISSLDKYRRTVYLMNEEELCASLATRLQTDTSKQNACIMAASVDCQRSTVRVVWSKRSGAGKTLYKIRRDEDLQVLTQSSYSLSVSLPLHERKVNINYVTGNLLWFIEEPNCLNARIFHIDITNEVQFGIDYLLFNLLILGQLVDKSGYVWRKMPMDLYLIETMERTGMAGEKEVEVLKLLPFVVCRSPKECLDIYNGKKPSDFSESDQLFDSKLYEMELYRNPYNCLRSIDKRDSEISEKHCIDTMLRHCGVLNPSWSEIYHFVKFLNTQLLDFKKTDFVSEDIQDTLPGFRMFVQRFLIQMSRDFSSRSLNISEESLESIDEEQEDDLQEYKIKRTWERSPHPYLFFNADRQTFTFLGFYINDFGHLVDFENNEVLERRIMSRDLLQALMQNGVPIKEDFDSLPRNDKIARLCRVMGVTECEENVYDQTYELTTDNCKKILAVYMRFRCDIPVIVMGETGCGKTRLVKFLCELMVPRDETTQLPLTTNMIIMKVHGGVTNREIKSKVWSAANIAVENCEKYDKDMYTVLFFDEANTTESIGLIKEIMCDNTMEGKPLNICKNLKFVAACNPYRKHLEDVITKLEKAGLGYHVRAIKTKDRFGRIPMRRLVYRVQPLPQSLLPFVWDFGQLSSTVENLYIRHMVRRYMASSDTDLPFVPLRNDEQLLQVVSSILTQSQEYMRNLKDECSFVSLRDVDRVLQVMCWFYSKSRGRRTLFTHADQKLRESGRGQTLNDETRSLILALAVCYHSSLSNRTDYWKRISQFFRKPCELIDGSGQILDEIERIQEVLLDSVKFEDSSNIARNQALKENVFMMVVCIELRIPLFLVGKPGSSKSLAKVIVTDAMQGRAAQTALFKEMKQVQMVSFQCSPLSSPEGIISTFRQCASFQQNYKENLDTFVSVVVLDEIGLAEDSERMPLKTLHPLLEDGCQGDEIPENYKKVAFIGISNWSLDPAKMNRGIFVQRQIPDSLELENTARGICVTTQKVNNMLIKPLSSAYLEVFKKASEEKREFFGLRDFYSLMKMINQIVKRSKQSCLPTYRKLRFAVRRNFSGLDTLDTCSVFLQEIKTFSHTTERLPGDPDDSFSGLMKSWIEDEYSENRHLLLLTENYSALPMFQQAFLTKESVRSIIIFGSSFRRDQEYTQICRNINKIKICMETGKLVILINSDNLYESLYDALNQYYVYFGGERYVDLGLGTHRVKCPVHKDFKLIVVAGKQTVYEKFPIPLINRLEKHCLTSKTLLTKYQNWLAKTLKEWVEDVTKDSLSLRDKATEVDAAKVFIGYHHDACSTIALETWTEKMSFDNVDHASEALDKSKDILLWCAAPDAILRLTEDTEEAQDIYWNRQAHESLKDYLSFHFKKQNRKKLYAQVTTHSTLLTVEYRQTLWESTGIAPNRILLLEALPSFDTEQQFISKIKAHIQKSNKEPSLLVIQCESGDRYTNLIACAKYAVLEECTKFMTTATISILFVVQLKPMENKSFHNIQCGEWHSAHIDNLYTPAIEMPSVHDMQKNRMSVLIAKSIESKEAGSMDRNEENEEQIELEQCLDLRKLVDRSLQRAVSLVRDPEEQKHRSTKRVSLILSILHDKSMKDRKGFVKGICVLVKNIMTDRENESLSTSPDMWLAKEASSVLAIEKYGTLRRACLQAFDTRMFPILGGIFAALDTNNNLSLLEYGENTWQKKLWISLINTKEISQYLFSGVNTERGLQFEAQGTGYGSRMFQCKMPFSWIIHNTFEGILKQHNRIVQEIQDQEQGLADILEGTELVKALDSVPETEFYDILESYIYDFVQTVYPEENDRKLVWLSIKQSTTDRVTADDNVAMSRTIMHVHRAYQESSTGLKYFRDISNVWSECADAVMNYKNKVESAENDLALLGLSTLLDHISPKDKESITECFKSESGQENWVGQVHRFRQVVNQTLTFCQDEMGPSSVMSKERFKWNRVVVMQLFIENLGSTTDDKLSFEIFPTLWALLGNTEVDMKQISPLKKIEKFLVLCCTKAKDVITSKAKRCAKCGIVLMRKRRVLPCMHELCGKCEGEIQGDSLSEIKCMRCQESPEKSSKEEGFAVDRIQEYRQRCNLVLMDIVSQLCFADNTAPEPDVIEWLMSYSFKTEVEEDQQLTNKPTDGKQDIGVDSNKVFKTFLFKHLVRTDEEEFRKHLEKFVRPKDEGDQAHTQLDDVILTLIFSIEDNLQETSTLRNVRKIDIVRECLSITTDLLENTDSVLDQIYGSARARMALSVCANYISVLLKQTESAESDESDELRNVLQMAMSFCEGRLLPWKFLLRNLAQEFGTDTVLSACRSTDHRISWIKMDEKVACTVDMYTACGDEYFRMKTFILKTMIENDKSLLLTHIQSSEDKLHLAVMLELVVHREIELQRCLKGEMTNSQDVGVFEEVILAFEGKFQMTSLLALDSGYLDMLHLSVSTGKDTDREINIKCLLFHWLCVIKHMNASCCKLLKPLFKLALQPGSVKNSFLPCMPQDELADIRQELLQEANAAYFGQRTVYYQCENGHSYEIGQVRVDGNRIKINQNIWLSESSDKNCGRPYVKAKCICGADIGGQFHVLQKDNKLDDGSDRSQTGHCLGNPRDRQLGAIPERSLRPTQCAIIKCLLHLTMYLGCGNAQDDVCSLIQTEICSSQVHQFLWDHLLLDLEDLQNTLSLNVDEVLLFVHSFIDNILRSGQDNECTDKDENDVIAPAPVDDTEDTDRTKHGIDDSSGDEEGGGFANAATEEQYNAEYMPDVENMTAFEDEEPDEPEFQEYPFRTLYDRRIRRHRYEHLESSEEESSDEEEGIMAYGLYDTDTTGDIERHFVEDTDNENVSIGEQKKRVHEIRGLPWSTKEGRHFWEIEFTSKYLSQFIEDRKDVMETAKHHLENSSSTGILAVLKEDKLDANQTTQPDNMSLSNNPEVWMYRKPVSIAHLQQAFQRHVEKNPPTRNDFPVLKLFLEQINELQAVRFVPNILQLHKTLFQRYKRQIYQSQASKISVGQLKGDKFAGDQTHTLLEDLTEAWNIARHALKNHDFRTDRGRAALPLELTNMHITDDTEITFLLPTMEGKGVCTFALLDFLIRRHNELIQTYISSVSGQRKQTFTVVDPKDLTSAHLISFLPQKDLLPIILASCSMSSKHTVDDEYDFGAIEKRIIDRFLSTKSKVIVDQRLQIDLMVYKSELTDVCELDLLARKIPQERLDTSVKSVLCNQVQDVPSIGQVLEDLDIAINFLNITGGDPEDSLYDYMVGRLKLTKTELKTKIQQTCLLKHVKSLWMTLSFHKSYTMVQQGKLVEVIFENIRSEYQEALPEDIMIDSRTYAEKLSKERLTQFLEVLFEFIMLELTKRENTDDEDYFDKSQYRLKDCLKAFADSAELTVEVDDIPDNIHSIHSLHIWIAASQSYAARIEDETEV